MKEDEVRNGLFKVAGAVLALGLALGVAAPPAHAAVGVKPQDGVTHDQPFAPGTGESQKFRIPGMVTLNDGTIVAATDARYNQSVDGGGLDTIVSRSKDNGKTWNYTYANYLGDNGNVWNPTSTAFIDPAISTDGETVYLVADLFPAGIALNGTNWGPQVGAGFDSKGNLRLRDAKLVPFGMDKYSEKAAQAEYAYYLKMDDKTIHKASDDSLVEGYTVDAMFNITTTTTGATTNLFCSDSPFQVFPTDYLYLTKSTDAGATWSEPTLINVKKDTEQVLLVGPGTGSVLKDGTLVFSVYEHTKGKEEAGIIWSTDKGKTWHRSNPTTTHPAHWSSEAVTVQIDDTTIRQFYRDGEASLNYTDFTKQADGTWKPGDIVRTSMKKDWGNQLSAIKLRGKVEGKDAIVVSTATINRRKAGKLYLGLIEDDKTITWRFSYDVVGDEDRYAYSSLTELNDGSIAVLYESVDDKEIFTIVPRDELIGDATDLAVTKKDVTIAVGDSKTFNDATGDYTNDVSTIEPAIATVRVERGPAGATMAAPGTANGYNGEQVALKSLLWNFQKKEGGTTYTVSGTTADNKTVYLAPGDYTSAAGRPVGAEAQDITLSAGKDAGTLYLTAPAKGNAGKQTGCLFFHRTGDLKLDRVDAPGANATWQAACSFMLYREAKAGEASSTELPGFVRVDVANASVADGAYLIVAKVGDSEYYAMRPTTDKSNQKCQIAKVVPTTSASTDVTFTAVKAGDTSERVGDILYRIHVVDLYDEAVGVDMDGTKEIVLKDVDLTGNVDDADFDQTLAGYKVERDGDDTKITLTGKVPGTTTLVVGKTRYTVNVTGRVVDVALAMGESETFTHVVTGTHESVTNNKLDDSVATVALEGMTGAEVGATIRDLSELEYTFKASGDGFTVAAQTADGKTVYLNPTGKGAGFPYSTDANKLTFSTTDEANTFFIYNGSHYLHFYRDGGNNGYVFDRVNNTANFKRTCAFALFRPATEDELAAQADSVIEGYVRVTALDQIKDGGRYIIASESNQGWYALNPSMSSVRAEQAAKINAGASTRVTITAKGAGAGSVRVGDTRFNVTVEAALVEHAVTFVDELNNKQATATVEEGLTVQKPADPAHDGYVFKGWSTSKDEFVAYDFTAPVTGDVTLYAHYEVSVYTVTLVNKFTEETSTVEVEHGEKLEQPAAPALDGYEFAGWSTSETEFEAYDFEVPVTSDLTLYASYAKKADPEQPPVDPEQPPVDPDEPADTPSVDSTPDTESEQKPGANQSGAGMPSTGDIMMIAAGATGAIGSALAAVGVIKRRR